MKKYFGFTLAEVLITLGIIGVVAALTIPTLIKNHQKHVYETKVKQTYSLVSNALEAARADYGDPKYWDTFMNFDTSDPDEYNKQHQAHMRNVAAKYFKPYLKVIDEGEGLYLYYMTLNNGVTLTFYPDGGVTPDGSTFIQSRIYIIGSLSHNHSTFLDASRDYSRKDFLMEYSTYTNYQLKFFNYNNSKTRDDYINHSSYGCNSNIQKNRRLYCGSLLFHDGWKIKDSYPW